MTDIKFRNMILRKKFFRRILLIGFTVALSFYVSVLLFSNLKTPVVMRLTNLDRCPACYGISLCPELYSNQIILDSSNDWSSFFNAKNIYYGFTKTNKAVVLKKLAHNWELKKFDSSLCKIWKQKRNCRPSDLLNVSNIDDYVLKSVQYNLSWPDVETRKGLIMCPYAKSIYDFIQPIIKTKANYKKSDMLNVWTMLSINPEPLILQVLLKSRGWPVPAWGGVCGRLEVVSHDGVVLSSLLNVAWHRRLLYAQKIINAAMDFTFRHDRFRFYLMDWSLDNIVVNEKDEVSFVDLEDVIVLDKFIIPGKDLPNWYERYSKEIIDSGFSFSIENMCKHHLSDHNIWAACYLLAADETPLLYPIPETVGSWKPRLERFIYKCLNHDDRFKTVTKLQQVINDMLNDENVVGVGVVR